MPHSPFTRFLGSVIVVLFALALLWPDDRAHEWGSRAAVTLPLLLGVFTWCAVRGAAPFDDRSFHRTLPPGDGPAFGRVLMIHGLVLGGIALVVLIYCGIFNLGWRPATYGVAALTLPVLAWMAAMGLAASLGTSRQHGKTWGYLAVFAAPAMGWGLMQWARSGFGAEADTSVYLTPLRTMLLTGATLYPLIWWLVAAKRRRVLGMMFTAWTGILLPWLSVYGYFDEAPAGEERSPHRNNGQLSARSTVTVVRRAFPGEAGKWIDLDQLLSVDGIAEKEFLTIHGFAVKNWRVPVFAVRDENSPPGSDNFLPGVTVGRSGGQITWSDRPLWEELASKLPPRQTLGYWTESMNPPARVAVLNPEIKQEDWTRDQWIRLRGNRRFSVEDLRTQPWDVTIGSPMRWEKAAEYDVAKGGTYRFPEGGILRVDPLHQEGDHFTISFKHYSPSLREADGPWFGNNEEDESWSYPRALLVDESGQHVFIVDPLSWETERSFMLAEQTQWTFDAGVADTPEKVKRMEMLRRSRIHVFWPVTAGQPQRMTLPPAE